MAEKDTQSRKWQITINNPVEKGFTHDSIRAVLYTMPSVIYWCMSDEIGENQTYHTHIYIQGRSGIRFSTIRRHFPGGHYEMAKGTAQQNMEYVSKTGKWNGNKKSETSVPGTFEEWGDLPVERQGRRNDLDDLYSMIKDGYSDYQILEVMPESLLHLEKLDKVRQVVHYERFKNVFRHVDVSYFYGHTGTGKTRSVVERYGYSNVYRVTDYRNPFDGYRGQDVVVFEEFRSSFPFSDLLSYLDGYPVELPCRYANKYACYTKVYIITNIPLSQQYTGVQVDSPESWMAFIRRAHQVVEFTLSGMVCHDVELLPDGFYRLSKVDSNPFEVVS